jgi:hypothetical protein
MPCHRHRCQPDFSASFKIICDRIPPLMAVGHFVGGESPVRERMRSLE